MAKSETIVEATEQEYDFFFYGTLCFPAILERVLGRICEDLTFQDGLLPNYTRHCVIGEDYPAVINRDQTNRLASRSEVLLAEDVNTRGTLVRGLQHSDVHAIDVFEGTEYSRKRLPIQSLTSPARISYLPTALKSPTERESMDNLEAERQVTSMKCSSSADKEKAAHVDAMEGRVEVRIVEAWVYVWLDDIDKLDPNIWSFEDFMKDKASAWMGSETGEYDEVDQHRALQTQPGMKQARTDSPRDDDRGDGAESKIKGKVMKGFPDFGHHMHRYWKFDKKYIGLNHGSYGSGPRPVHEAARKLTDEIESCPDRFMRRTYLPMLKDVRKTTASLIGAAFEEVVFVPNATHAINTITGSIAWADGDVIVIYSTTYGAIAQTVKCICDRHSGVSMEVVNINFPCPRSLVVEKTEAVLKKYNEPAVPSYTGESKPTGKGDKRVKMVVLDAIASNPGILYPWEEIVKLCKKYGALSLVDAAHAIGQIMTDVKKADCDFWVANCHKWLYGLRSAAVMYVPLKNQHLIRSPFPTGAWYESTRYPTEGINRPWSFQDQYEWNGTQDWAPYLTVADALKFRESIGGEDRIMRYCHTLAVQGGKRLAKKWGTPVMDNKENDLTAAMVNVALPDVPEPDNLEEQFRQLTYFENGLLARNCFAPPYRHAGRWWARFSAQVWNELEDFDYLGDAFSEICEGVRLVLLKL